MPARPRHRDIAADRARSIRVEIGRELRAARLDRDLSLADVARATGISAPQGSRIERGQLPSLTLSQAATWAEVVGLRLAARLYAGGNPIRDAAHGALLHRLRARLHGSLTMTTEVPLPIAGDRRAWDAVIRGRGWSVPVEAETRPRDIQALDRRVALKLRDADMESVLLLLLDSAHNRRLLREDPTLRTQFPLSRREMLRALQRGERPDGSGIVLL